MYTNTKCSICGKFMSLTKDKFVERTSFGGVMDLEPPEPDFIHETCWNNLPETMKELFTLTSWVGPHIVDPKTGDIMNQ